MNRRLLILLIPATLVLGAAGYYWWRSSTSITFATHVAPIIADHCAACHRPGEAAPFDLLTYDDVRKRGQQIVEVTHRKFMPPWLPTSPAGLFANDRRLSDEQLQTIKRWFDTGMSAGDLSRLNKAAESGDPWKTNPPDLILESDAYRLTDQRGDLFRNFVIQPNLKFARWVKAMEIRADNPRVTHHARVGIDSTNESLRRDADDPEPGYAGMAWGQDPDGQMAVWAPGVTPTRPTPGTAWRLHPQSTLVLHSHLQPSGKPETVKFRVGLWFAAEPPTVRPMMLRIGSCDIDIPANAPRHVVEDRFTLPIDAMVQTIFPHAHSLCQEIHVTAERPDGNQVSMMAIDRFDENWHEVYRYRAPLPLPRGTKIHTRFVYDNTDKNPRNRQRPARRVTYGSNATDEMSDVFLQVMPAMPDQYAVLREEYQQYQMKAEQIGHRRALESNPNDPWHQEALAACHMALGEPTKALAILEDRVKIGPPGVFPVVSLGMVELMLGKTDSAEARFRQALKVDNEYALAWFGLGRVLVAQKKTDEAEKAFRRALELSPALVEASLQLADIQLQKGQLEEAKKTCFAAAESTPDSPAVYLKLGAIAAKENDLASSFNHCVTAHLLAPYTHPPKVLVAGFFHSNGAVQKAVDWLREAQAELPAHPMPSLLLGQIARSQQQLPYAKEFLEQAVSRPIPANWPASHRKRFLILLHSERAQLGQQLQDVALTRDALTQWLAAEPDNQRAQSMLNALPK